MKQFLRLIPLLLLLLGVVACEKKAPQTVTTERVIEYREAPKAEIIGVVSVPQNFPSHGVLVYLEGTSYMALSDRDGYFSITGVPEGQYYARAERVDLETRELGPVAVTKEDLTNVDGAIFDLGLSRMDALGSGDSGTMAPTMGEITGRVVLDNPLDIAGVSVSIQGSDRVAGSAYTNEAGVFSLSYVPVGKHTIRVSREGYNTLTKEVRVLSRQVTDVGEIRLEAREQTLTETRSIMGALTLVGAEGEIVTDYSGVVVTIEELGRQTEPDQTGIFQFSSLNPDVYTVTASSPDYTLQNPVTVDLSALEFGEVDLTLIWDGAEDDGLGSVIGSVLLEDGSDIGNAGVIVSLTGSDKVVTTNRDGLFQFLDVPVGLYEISATISGYKTGLAEGVEVIEGEETVVDTIVLESDKEYPEVIAFSPNPGAKDVTIDSPTAVIIQFNQKMSVNSLRSAISVDPEVDFRLAGRGQHPEWSEDRAILLMAGQSASGTPMRFGTRYTVTVSASAENLEGLAMKEPYKASFTTGEAKIIDTWPKDGDEGVYVYFTEPVRVYFNTAIDTSEFSADDIRIRPDLPSQPNFHVERDSSTGWSILTISGFFQFDEEYEVRLGRGIKTNTGSRISNMPYEFSFKTTERVEGNPRLGANERERD